jgi:hypothetical protein
MALISQKPTVQVQATFQLDEEEMRALDALAGYGTEVFLKTFYEKLGREYLEPHENGLRKLFKTVRDAIPAILERADEARKAFG